MSRLLILGLVCCLAGCTNFLELRRELQESRSQLGRISGSIVSPSCPDCPTILVAVDSMASRVVLTYRVFERPGAFSMVTFGGSRHLFAFNDLNKDFQFQEDEPSAWLSLPEHFAAGKHAAKLHLVLRQHNHDRMPAFGNLSDLSRMTLGAIDVELGTEAPLDDPRFAPDKAAMGLWQPLKFMREGYAGTYFLAEYDPAKIPVLFVHGINGSPRDFSRLIAGIDQQQFQPWGFL